MWGGLALAQKESHRYKSTPSDRKSVVVIGRHFRFPEQLPISIFQSVRQGNSCYFEAYFLGDKKVLEQRGAEEELPAHIQSCIHGVSRSAHFG